MAEIVTFSLTQPLKIVPGTILIRCDTFMVERPGAGGYAIIIDGLLDKETMLITRGFANTDSETLTTHLVKLLAEQITENRAVVITRSQATWQTLSTKFQPFRLIRVLAYSAYAVADATRYAHVSAVTAQCLGHNVQDKLVIGNYVSPSENSDMIGKSSEATLEAMLRHPKIPGTDNQQIRRMVQETFNAAEAVDVASLQKSIDLATANDIPKDYGHGQES